MTATTIKDIVEMVVDHAAVATREIHSPCRLRYIAWPRQEAMYVAREVTGSSLPQIGKEIGNRDHTTVMHAIKQVKRRMSECEITRRRVEKFIEQAQVPVFCHRQDFNGVFKSRRGNVQ